MNKQDLNPQDVMRDFVEDLKTLSLSNAEEIDKLREKNAKLHQLIEGVASESPYWIDGYGEQICFFCAALDGEKHEDYCVWKAANELGGVDE